MARMYGGLRDFEDEKWIDSVSMRVWGGACERLLLSNHPFRRMGTRGVRGVRFVLCEFIPWGGEAGFYMQIIPG